MFYLISQIFLCLLLAALIGGIVGWLLKHLLCRRALAELEEARDAGLLELEACRRESDDCGGELETARSRLAEIEASLAAATAERDREAAARSEAAVELELAQSRLADLDLEAEAPSGDQPEEAAAVDEPEEIAAVDGDEAATPATAALGLAAMGAAAVGGPPPKDDLKKVEGIGPKIEELLNADGIHTFAQLAAAPVADVQAILDRAGPRYRVHDPATWGRQAALAAAGRWDELEELQDRLQGGREAPAEALGLAGGPPPKDDLKRVEGIGPKIEGLLNAAGLHTFAQLAAAPVADVQAVLDRAGPRYRIHDPGTWARQAALAADGEWDELEELQDRLKGGREA